MQQQKYDSLALFIYIYFFSLFRYNCSCELLLVSQHKLQLDKPNSVHKFWGIGRS